MACKAESPPAESPAPAQAPVSKESPAPSAETDATDAAAPEAAAAAPAAEPESPPKSGPERPYTVLIVGGSVAATGLGALLENKLDGHPHIVAKRRAKSASGLARPDFFDWMAEGKRLMEVHDPDLVIVLMGGNDGQDLPPGKGEKRAHWDTMEWSATYRQRVDAFLNVIAGPERKVMWLGLPRTNTRNYEAKLDVIRGVQRAAVDAMGEAGHYVDTSQLLEDPDGNLMKAAPVGPRGKVQDLRGEDGIHFTMAGSQYFADSLYPLVLEELSLEEETGEQETGEEVAGAEEEAAG